MPEEFLNHVKQAVHACERQGHFSDYDEACKRGTESVSDYKKVLEDHKNAKERKAPPAEIKVLKESREGHYKAVAEHEQERVDTAEGFFSLYANLLLVVAWDKIVNRQIGVTPWTDLKGKTQMKKRAKTRKSFDDCVKADPCSDRIRNTKLYFFSISTFSKSNSCLSALQPHETETRFSQF